MRWSLSVGISLVALLAVPAPQAYSLDVGLEGDLDLVVKMPLAVADAFDAGVAANDLSLLTRSLIDGAVPPVDFIEVVTLSPVVYRVTRVDLAPGAAVRVPDRDRTPARRAAVRPGIGVFVQRQLARGLRGPELATAIHRELHRRGVPAGPPGLRIGVQGPERVALDLRGLRELRVRRDGWVRDRDEGRLEIRGSGRRPGHVPPGQLKKGGRGKGRGVPPGHAKARGRGHAKGHGDGKGRGNGHGGER